MSLNGFHNFLRRTDFFVYSLRMFVPLVRFPWVQVQCEVLKGQRKPKKHLAVHVFSDVFSVYVIRVFFVFFWFDRFCSFFCFPFLWLFFFSHDFFFARIEA